ncbi:hypothetical protein DFQ28_007622 [Apophysomyces sp. BC1034]|nr:hypothetical protein DFQ30_007481 [Apophysomyces sp. BC1015]KAG0176314.1 hypothetical protein DFQ29_006298 [Apophysomyces sp. BC1021]KAG0186552.1 hypothetical protein DFQ28_007622 [Apophysomyces sp. BC1034]
MLCVLPDELLLRVLKFIDNPVDLVPLTITCRRLRRLAVDWTLWSDAIGIEASSNHAADALAILAKAFEQAGPQRTSAITIAATHTYGSVPQFLHAFLQCQQLAYPQHLQLYAPTTQHPSLLKTLSERPCPWVECTFRDPKNDYAVLHPDSKTNLLRWLDSCRTTLEILELPACPSNWLMMIDGHFTKVRSLALALEPLGTTTTLATGSDPQRYWELFREKFPRLRHLTLHLTQDSAFPLFKSLLSNRSLFPWIERITIVSQEDPKKFIHQHELHVGLMRLDGLLRITAGWDLIALDMNS